MNITVYAASSGQVPAAYIEAAGILGKVMAERGHTLINGAGRTGLMGATTEGVLAHGGKAIGVIPQFMIEQGWQHNEMTELLVTSDMHSRKETMAQRSDACIALPGGYCPPSSARYPAAPLRSPSSAPGSPPCKANDGSEGPAARRTSAAARWDIRFPGSYEP